MTPVSPLRFRPCVGPTFLAKGSPARRPSKPAPQPFPAPTWLLRVWKLGM